MDIGSLIGFLGAVGMIVYAMASGGGIGPFLHAGSALIVVGGTFFAVMYTCTLPQFLNSFKPPKSITQFLSSNASHSNTILIPIE